MKYPSEASVIRTASSLNKNRRSSGDLSNVSHRYDFHVVFGFSSRTSVTDGLSPAPSSCSTTADFSSAPCGRTAVTDPVIFKKSKEECGRGFAPDQWHAQSDGLKPRAGNPCSKPINTEQYRPVPQRAGKELYFLIFTPSRGPRGSCCERRYIPSRLFAKALVPHAGNTEHVCAILSP